LDNRPVSEPSTRIHLCGRLVIEIEGERLEQALPGRQGRLLFAYLALNRDRPVRRDELIDAVWPEPAAPAQGEALLRPALSRLRKALGQDRVGGRGEPALLLPDGAWIDWEAALRGSEAARTAIATGQWRAALTEAAAVVLIAEVGLLPGLEAEWIEERRRQLADLRVEALEAVATAGVALGGPDLPAAERAARAAVEAAPFRESARAVLIEALRASGNVAEAMRAYDDIRTMLLDELGTTPGARLLRLHEQLLTGEPPPEPSASAAAAPLPRHPRPARSPGIVERDDEVGQVDHLLAAAAERQGRVALIEGPAGIGKSRLLAEARLRAGELGTRVLAARGSEFERAFPFGAVRQLFEAELADSARRERLLAGAAAPAAAVFAAPGDEPAEGGGDASFAALHGLFWLAVNLAAEGPLVLAVDDLQWCDTPSLRFAAYLTQRLEGLPLLLVATIRTGEEMPDAGLIGEIAQDQGTVAIRPHPLTEAAVAGLVRERLGDDADDAFCATCHRTTVGNPLLLRQLLTALELDGVRPTGENTEIVTRIGSGAVSRSVLLRLGRLGDEAVAVARAAAVLGDSALLPVIATMAELDEDRAAAAAGALARAEILHTDRPVGFVHPLVRDAVYSDLPLGERELQHDRAARMLHGAAAPAEQVAAHLLLVPPHRGDEWVVERLREAADAARSKGAADSASTYLHRALEEETSLERRPRILFELGAVEGLTDGPAAAAHLRAAYASLRDPLERAAVAEVLGRTLLFTGLAQEGIEVVREAAAALPADDPDLRKRLEAIEMMAIFFGAGDQSDLRRVEAYREPPPSGASLGAKMLAGVASLQWAYAAGPAEKCVELALAALEGEDLMAADNGMLAAMPIYTLTMADWPGVPSMWERFMGYAHRRGSLFAASTAHLWQGGSLYYRGELGEAEAMLRTSLEEFAAWGYAGTTLHYARAFLAMTLTSRGDFDAAWEQIDAVHDSGDGADGTRWWLLARAELMIGAGRYEEAIELLDDVGRRWGWIRNPGVNHWSGLKSICLWRLGRHEEGLELCIATLEGARSWGTAIGLAPGLRVTGTMLGPEEGLPYLRQSLELVEASTNRHQHARSLVALGETLLERGELDEGRDLLRQAVELGVASGSRPVVAAARAALAKSGVRQTVEAQTAAALTPTERRMAELAARGASDREIAEAMYVTPNTVGRQLAAACRKLGVSGRDELGDVLASAA
jgi:DNA-binding SARP family transcriptional activator/DNA-binding CsgD family transcriptional regulator